VLTSSEIAIAEEWPGEDLPRCILTVALSTIARIEWLGAERPEDDPPACIHGTEKNTMEIEGLRTALRRAPFRPFRMFLSDGSHHDVMHPDRGSEAE